MNGRRIVDERGLIGKMAVVSLVVIALLGVGAFDTISIVRTRLSLADAADAAATEGAANFADHANVSEACAAAAEIVAHADRRFHVARGGCRVDPVTRKVTLILRTRASTILVGRIGPLSRFARIVEQATIGPPSL
jgi:uncharacterized membrane protein